ncbi:uncharacterized protein LOC117175602 isoform X2 [Belonocnema kinseyi]|uniref:uncharacterized protein LOC117175602 isoform X2 n=1 Tax=Belonocnema kinseyi TaxID=2817044 RepID=UPI00143DA4FE|nr:uncharacterized protein LOC117175602 isoform X2 [Belonocnema kinseyi]
MAPLSPLAYKYEDYYSSDEVSDSIDDEPPPKRQRASTFVKSESEISEKLVRGRKPSKTPCPNKTAELARKIRERKKQHLEGLEGQVKCLKELNDGYRSIIQEQSANGRRLQAEVNYLKSVLHKKRGIANFLGSLNENLKSRPNEEETSSSRNERVIRAKEEFSKKRIFEDIKIEPNNGFQAGSYEALAEFDNYEEDPLLGLKSESFDIQLPLTPLSLEDNCEKYQALQHDLSIVPPNLLPSDNFDIVAYFSGLDDEADALDFQNQPIPFKEENYFDNSNMDIKTAAA